MIRRVSRPRRRTGEAPRSVHLTFDGRLDHETADDLLSAVDSALSAPDENVTELLLDCSGIRSCDSPGLSCLLMARRRADARGVRLHLLGVPQHMRRLFARTGTWHHLVPDAEHPTSPTGGTVFPRAPE